MLNLMPHLDLKLAFVAFCGKLYIFGFIVVLFHQVTVDSATLQAMQGLDNASVSQDSLGNTTIIYEQGQYSCQLPVVFLMMYNTLP